MNSKVETPFDTVENAKEYVRLLVEAVADARRDVDADIAAAHGSHFQRRLQALRLVQFKLDKLEQYLRSSGRMLNDLRTLRRLLLQERADPSAIVRGVEELLENQIGRRYSLTKLDKSEWGCSAKISPGKCGNFRLSSSPRTSSRTS